MSLTLFPTVVSTSRLTYESTRDLYSHYFCLSCVNEGSSSRPPSPFVWTRNCLRHCLRVLVSPPSWSRHLLSSSLYKTSDAVDLTWNLRSLVSLSPLLTRPVFPTYTFPQTLVQFETPFPTSPGPHSDLSVNETLTSPQPVPGCILRILPFLSLPPLRPSLRPIFHSW